MSGVESAAPPGSASAAAGAQAKATAAITSKQLKQTTQGVYRLRRHLRAIRMMLNALLILALMYTVTIVRALVIPLVLAAFLGLALNPIVVAGTRHRVPRWLGASVLMISLITAIGAGISMLAQPAVTWLHSAPTAIRSFIPKLEHITRPLEAAGRATQTLVNGHPAQANAGQNPGDVAISVWDVLANAPKVLAAILTVVLLV